MGNVNGQNNWSTTDDENGGFITNQVITDEKSKDGPYALKLTTESAFEPQPQPIVGAYYTFETPISSQAAVFSVDIYISEQGPTSFRNIFGLVDLEENKYRTYLDFFYDGKINVFVRDSLGIQWGNTDRDWVAETWINAKIETYGDSVKFLIDDELIYKGLLLSTGLIHQVRFIHDNHSGTTYLDNFMVNGENLSVKNPSADVNFTHFYNADNQSLILSSSLEQFRNLIVYNSLGQKIINKKLSQNDEVVDLTALTNGIYTVKINVGNASKTIKVFKY